jgi:hypothetical protein
MIHIFYKTFDEISCNVYSAQNEIQRPHQDTRDRLAIGFKEIEPPLDDFDLLKK